jgi:uncharacterized lipoprotein YddW (UPF0748 family)
VGNVDWPSKPGLPVRRQKQELIAILDKASELKLNVVVFQVRAAADAFYPSQIEPWSEYLTGQMGEPPQPFYDPLQFAIEEAHKRGLELHAWFNPYRARFKDAKSSVSPLHVSKRKPALVKQYGSYLWLDPGMKAVQDYSFEVIMDVVRRYDIDGVHFDDYFYPYKERDKNHNVIAFPDDDSFRAYVDAGGKLGRDDWRRESVNTFIQRVYQGVHQLKPWVRFGISPFGIWRPGNPPGIQGLDSYNELYGDSRKWVQEGWVDYIAPQLYWDFDRPAQSFTALLKWWVEQNKPHHLVLAGIITSRIGDASSKGFPASTILRQIEETRRQPGASGDIQFSMKALMKNPQGISDKLKSGPYAGPALVPATTWLDPQPPQKPTVWIDGLDQPEGGRTALRWQVPAGSEAPWLWAIYGEINGVWRMDVVPGRQTGYQIDLSNKSLPKVMAVSAIDRNSNESARSIIEIPER